VIHVASRPQLGVTAAAPYPPRSAGA
jgi:hypothetical protein